ncbi:MAG: hypothetical protein ACRDKI_07995 [Solirubrobacterales bacterium]
MHAAVFACLLFAILIAAAAPPAHADVSTTSVMQYLDSSAIGRHSAVQLTVNFTYTGSGTSESVRNVRTEMPPGALGDPQSVPTAQRCNVDYTAASPDYSTCPATSKVGDATVNVYHATLSPLLGELAVTGSIYLLNNRPSPSPEIPGYVGIFIQPPTGIALLNGLGINLTGRITARNKTDYGLSVQVLEDIPNQLAGAIRTDSLALKLFKFAPNGSYFTSNPTRCDAWTTSSYARSWTTNGSANADVDPAIPGNDFYKSSSTTTPDCSSMPPFDPGASITAATSKAGAPTAMTLSLTRPNAPASIVQPHMKKVDITFPDGVEINPALAQDIGDTLCTDAQFDKANPDMPSTCPASSQIATITTVLPLMSQPTVGKMYLGQPGAGEADRYRAFIDLPGNMGVKFEGRVTIDSDGRIHASVGDAAVDRPLPQVPYSDISMVSKGGSRAAFVNPVDCGTHTGSVTFTPWSGQTPVTKTLTLVTDYDGAGAPCPAQRPFNPSFAMSPTGATSGSNPDLHFTVTRADGDENIRSAAITLPQGLIAAPAAAAECSDAQLAANSCPVASEVGDVTAAAGSGAETLALNGKIYNVKPPSGEVAKLAAVVPAIVGPYDLGLVTLPLSMTVNDDLGVTATSADVPARVGGVAVRLRTIDVHLYAEAANGHFTRVPSRCGTHAVSADIESTDDQTVHATTTLTTSGCEALPFDPAFAMTAKPDPNDRKGDLPAWNIHLGEPAGDSAIADLKLTFPNSVSSNLAALGGLCENAAYLAGTCPAAGRLGTVHIETPLLPYALDGDVLLVRAIKPNAVTPRVALSLDTPFKLRIAGETQFVNGNQIFTEFAELPDLPVSSIDVNLLGGSRGIMQLQPAENCGTLAYSLTGHGGQVKNGSLPFGGQACADFQQSRCHAATLSVSSRGMRSARAKAKKSARFGATLELPTRCPAIRSFAIQLPKGSRITSKKLKKAGVSKRGRWLEIKRVTAASKVTIQTKRGAVLLPACRKSKPCWKRKLSFNARAELDGSGTWSGKLAVKRKSRTLR